MWVSPGLIASNNITMQFFYHNSLGASPIAHSKYLRIDQAIIIHIYCTKNIHILFLVTFLICTINQSSAGKQFGRVSAFLTVPFAVRMDNLNIWQLSMKREILLLTSHFDVDSFKNIFKKLIKCCSSVNSKFEFTLTLWFKRENTKWMYLNICLYINYIYLQVYARVCVQCYMLYSITFWSTLNWIYISTFISQYIYNTVLSRFKQLIVQSEGAFFT